MKRQKKALTVLTLASKEASDWGRFAKQFCRCTSDISAAVDCAFLRGAIVSVTEFNLGFWGTAKRGTRTEKTIVVCTDGVAHGGTPFSPALKKMQLIGSAFVAHGIAHRMDAAHLGAALGRGRFPGNQRVACAEASSDHQGHRSFLGSPSWHPSDSAPPQLRA